MNRIQDAAPRRFPWRPWLSERRSAYEVEEGTLLAPKFNTDGLLPVVTSDTRNGEVLMLGWMNAEALIRTIETGEAHYWSRSRKCLWRKGAASGLVQTVDELRIDDDQDAVWLRVTVQGNGASCHVGYRSCFYRSVDVGGLGDGPLKLRFREGEKVFEPADVYGDAPNPTQL